MVQHVSVEAGTVHVRACTATLHACCPSCSTRSRRLPGLAHRVPSVRSRISRGKGRVEKPPSRSILHAKAPSPRQVRWWLVLPAARLTTEQQRYVHDSDLTEFHDFATGLRRDEAAVQAAIEHARSNGQTEGQVNHLDTRRHGVIPVGGVESLNPFARCRERKAGQITLTFVDHNATRGWLSREPRKASPPGPGLCDTRGFDESWSKHETWREYLMGIQPEPPVTVERFLGPPQRSAARPVWVECSDQRVYLLKSCHMGKRSLVSEQIVARIGKAVGAPIPEVRVLDLPDDLLRASGSDFAASQTSGLAHGSLKIDGYFEPFSDRLLYIHHGDNRARYMRLAVLFGMTVAGDQQFLAHLSNRSVWSVDHGMFLRPRLPREWKDPCSPGIGADDLIVDQCTFTPEEWRAGCKTLAEIQPHHIAEAIGALPHEWYDNPEEPALVAWYLAQRRERLIAYMCAMASGGELS